MSAPTLLCKVPFCFPYDFVYLILVPYLGRYEEEWFWGMGVPGSGYLLISECKRLATYWTTPQTTFNVFCKYFLKNICCAFSSLKAQKRLLFNPKIWSLFDFWSFSFRLDTHQKITLSMTLFFSNLIWHSFSLKIYAKYPIFKLSWI